MPHDGARCHSSAPQINVKARHEARKSGQTQLMWTSEKHMYITTRCLSAETGLVSQTECSSGCTTPLHVACTRQFAPNERKEIKNRLSTHE